jgi:N-acetylmuramoyl-L-alanine amidase
MYKSVVLDFGHGGLDKDGNYTTAPNKMYRHSEKEIAYEGVINRQIGGMIHAYLRTKEPDLQVVTTVGADDPRDLSLPYRVGVANKLKADETIFISVHSNASKNHNARGFEIYTTRAETTSDSLATSIGHHVKELYTALNLKLRFDFEDGDLVLITSLYR